MRNNWKFITPLYYFIILISVICFNIPGFAQYSGQVSILDSLKSPLKYAVPPGTNKFYLQVSDKDKNTDSNLTDTMNVTVLSSAYIGGKIFTLNETGPNTGVFLKEIIIDTLNANNFQGDLQYSKGDTLYINYYDDRDEFGNSTVIKDSIVLGAITGVISGQKLTKKNSPYVVVDELRVEGYGIEIEPGVILKFARDAYLYIDMVLPNGGWVFNINGTNSEPIIFTSENNNPQPGDWGGIFFDVLVPIKLNHVIIEYAQSALSNIVSPQPLSLENSILRCNNYGAGGAGTAFLIRGAIKNCIVENNTKTGLVMGNRSVIYGCISHTMMIENSIIKDNGDAGVGIYDCAHVTMDHCTITQNGTYGIYMADEHYEVNSLDITNSNLYNNGKYDLYNDRRSTGSDNTVYKVISAKFNYWGTATTSEMNAGNNPKNINMIYDKYDDPVKGFVNYGSWQQDTINIAEQPLAVRPADGSMVDQQVNFAWEDTSESAYSYKLQVSEDNSFGSILYEKTVQDTAEIVGSLDEGTKYYWRLRLTSIAGESNFTIPESFITYLNEPSIISGQVIDSNKILIEWTDKSIKELGYIIERKDNISDSFTIIDTTNENATNFTDSANINMNDYFYRIKAFNSSSYSKYSNIIKVSKIATSINKLKNPAEFFVSQNYPNPFNPSTVISYSIPGTSKVSLKVYDSEGRLVITLVNEEKAAGTYKTIFNGSGLSSGVYFYRIQAGNFTAVRKFVLMK